MLAKIVNDELITLLGSETAEINLEQKKPIVVLVAGLQGSGKTTSVAKLAHWLQTEKKQKVLVTSADVYRPAAIDQLKTLAESQNVTFYPSTPEDKPVDIATAALADAKSKLMDVVIVDTAGRLHIDETMMDEVKTLHQAIQPAETLFVVDSIA